jgi:uncharacterized integral membrane protein (TIGR00697 family)
MDITLHLKRYHGVHLAYLMGVLLLSGSIASVRSMPLPCAVLPAAWLLFGLHGLAHYIGKEYASWLAKLSMGYSGVVGGIVWLLGLLEVGPTSMVSTEVWHEVLGAIPSRGLLWAGALGLAWWGSAFWHRMPIAYMWRICGGTLWGGGLVMLLHYGAGRHTEWIASWPLIIYGGAVVGLLAATLLMALLLWCYRRWVGLAPKMWRPTACHHLYDVLFGCFGIMLLLTNVVTVKYTEIAGYTITTGILLYPCTYIFTDILCELLERRDANTAIWGGLIASLLLTLLLLLPSIWATHAASPVSAKAFHAMFSVAPGIVLASMTAYLVGEFVDVTIFLKLRGLTGGKHLWLRNGVATMVSEGVDMLVFSWVLWIVWPRIAWWGGVHAIAWDDWYALTCNEYLLAVSFGLLGIPLLYGGRRLACYLLGR